MKRAIRERGEERKKQSSSRETGKDENKNIYEERKDREETRIETIRDFEYGADSHHRYQKNIVKSLVTKMEERRRDSRESLLRTSLNVS